MKDKIDEVADYIITSVNPHNGIRRHIHREVNGAKCYIADAEVGYRGTIMFFKEDDNRFHHLHTSDIRAISEVADGNCVEIVTKNTTYVLERINFNESFKGVQSYQPVHALKEVMDYFNEHGVDTGGIRVADLSWNLYSIKKENGIIDYGAMCESLCSQYLPKKE